MLRLLKMCFREKEMHNDNWYISQGGFINFLVGDILLLLKLIVSYYTSSCSHVFCWTFCYEICLRSCVFSFKKKKNFSATHTIHASDNHLISLKKKNV